MAKKKNEQVNQEKDDLIEGLILDLNKKYNDIVSMTLEDSTGASVKMWIPSGDPSIDEVLGGGWPCGRTVEVFGQESSGKTTLALTAIKECQKMNGVAVFLDTEHALDRERAKALGVDLKKMIYAAPETLEEVFQYAEDIIEVIRKKDTERPVIIVWDSVAATPTKAEVEGDYDDRHVGVQARAMSQGLKKITSKISQHNILFMCVNQMRTNVGVMYGNPDTTPGGRALRYYSSMRVKISKVGQHKEGGVVAGIKCKIKTEKNKIAPPFAETEFTILFDKENAGIDSIGSLLDAGHKELFGGTAGWYDIQGKKMRKNEARKFLKENPDVFKMYYDTLQSMK